MTPAFGWLCAAFGFGTLILAALVTAHFTQRAVQELRKLRELVRLLLHEWRNYR